jgi:hypothetical protein
MALEPGDELISKTGTVLLKANCGKADLELSGPFHVRFLLSPSAKAGCKFWSVPQPGAHLNISSSGPTDVRSPQARMGTKKTEYEIRYSSVPQSRIIGVKGRRRLGSRTKVQQEVIAYKDDVAVKLRGRPALIVNQGEKVVTTGLVARVDNITAQDIAETASVKARIEVSQLPSLSPAERSEAFLKLQTLHQGVLADPGNQPKLINLVKEQIKLGVPADARVIPASTPTPAPIPTPTPTPTSTPTPASTPTPTPIHQPTPGIWLELNANTKTVEPLKLTNKCSITVRIKIKARLGFGRLVSGNEIEIPPGSAEVPGETYVRFEFDTTRTKPGDYKGELLLDCLNCPKENSCSEKHKHVPMNIHVKEVTVEPTRTYPKDEQGELFELLRQGKDKEAIDGFGARVVEKLADSRDYYGLAVAYEHTNDNERAAVYANDALKAFATDRRMSKEELIDCERIAKLPVKEVVPPQDEQGPLFELLGLGRYKEAIAGFDLRVQENRANSRDYYGLARAYEQLRDIKPATVYANDAFKLFAADQRMSNEEQVDCARIAKLLAEYDKKEAQWRSERGQLFALLRQGSYKEASKGFLKHELDKELPLEARDYYGLALAFEGLKEIGRARINARRALAKTKPGGDLDNEEIADCERITRLPVSPSDEQARLFELLSQRKYKEALPFFEERTKEVSGDARDFYGLALTYEGLRRFTLAKSAAEQALVSNKLTKNLDQKELDDCERIASGRFRRSLG